MVCSVGVARFGGLKSSRGLALNGSLRILTDGVAVNGFERKGSAAGKAAEGTAKGSAVVAAAETAGEGNSKRSCEVADFVDGEGCCAGDLRERRLAAAAMISFSGQSERRNFPVGKNTYPEKRGDGVFGGS